MTAVRKELRNRRKPIGFFAAFVALAAVLVFAIGANTASLPGSNFEIDGQPLTGPGANLKVDGTGSAIDWIGQNETRRTDTPSGQNDDSYAGGAKEDDACPGTTTGSIPNNKSDLKTFGAYVESEADGPGFLNLFWHRVNDPSGTTLMDFELNQSTTGCGNGVNPIRTVGDLLIEYRIDQGGAVATVKVRTWSGSAWGAAVDLTGTQALASINNVAIPAADSDGLSPTPPGTPVAARTFGEMQLDLDFIFDENDCESFGSAFVKSRSSDSFTSQLKDLIKPVPVNITNCGSVIIRKQTDPEENPNTTTFGYTKSFSTDPSTPNTFTLQDDGVKTFNNVLTGDDYTVVEDVVPSGWDLDHIDCSASTGVTPGTNGATITFDIDNAADVVDCTYYNKARGTIIVEKITDDGFGPFDFTSGTLGDGTFTLTTTAAGSGGKDDETFANLTPGTYDVAESATAGWHIVGTPSCSDPSSNSTPAAINLAGGETVTCTFHNARDRGAIDISKLRKHAASGPGDWPQAGVTFTVTGASLPAAGVTAVTDANGHACVGNLLLGNYTVTETVPDGYHNVGGLSQAKTVSVAATCAAGTRPLATFHNIPLTDVTVTVDSQVDGGTASDIDCDDGTSGSTGANGDGSVTVEDLEPTAPAVTLTCTITIDP